MKLKQYYLGCLAHASYLIGCESGYRSAIAASLLQRAGFRHVSDLVGGLAAWASAKLPIAGPA